MTAENASLFYTGLVAELFEPLRSVEPDPRPYERFIATFGEPALELGCGGGDPLLALRGQGLDVEGLDSSPDMLSRCRARAGQAGVDVVLHESAIEKMDLPRRYRSIFLAGPTFNLLPDDDHAKAALERIAAHLLSDGAALIPLFIPEPAYTIGETREVRSTDGALLRVTTVAVERDEDARRHTTLLRYEQVRSDAHTVVERKWVLHWHSQSSFRDLAERSGLRVAAILDATGEPAPATAQEFAFVLTRA